MKRPSQVASSFFIFYPQRMPLEQFTLPSFAKINWLLQILGKRDDGFHELCTVFQTVSLMDYLTFAENMEIILTCSDEKIPVNERNLIVKAAKKMQEKFKVKKGAKIYLEKNIPSPGGLGGGSSNAAVALIGLAKLWNIKFDLEEFVEIGKQLGADVPFFLCGGTAVGVGRGDEVSEMEDLEEKHLLIVTPNVSISTVEAFRAVNAPNLTNKSSKSILQICRKRANTLDLRQLNLVNDFENTVFNIEPEIERVKNRLLKCGCRQALLSGSGASVFAVFADAKRLQNALDHLSKEPNCRVFAARTISRREYRASLNYG